MDTNSNPTNGHVSIKLFFKKSHKRFVLTFKALNLIFFKKEEDFSNIL